MAGPPPIPSDYLHSAGRMARRAARFWRPGLVAFGAVLAATLGASVLARQYRSEAVVHYREGIQWTGNEGMSPRRVGQRLKDVLLARAQLAKVIEEMGLYPGLVKAGKMADAVEEMRLATTFGVTEGDIFVIAYTGDSPKQAQRVTARLTDVLIDENARMRSEQAEVASAFLDAEKKRNAADLAAKEGEQLRFLAKHPEFAHEQSAIGTVLRTTARRSGDAAGAHAAGGGGALGALRREEERLRRQISSPTQIPRAPRDPVLVAARNDAEAALKAAQRELADRRARFTEQHPDVRTAASLVKEATDAYKRASLALDAAESVQVEPRAVLEQRLTQVRQDIAAYGRSNPARAAPDQPAGSSDAAQRIVALETEWTRLNRDVTEARERFQQLDTKQFMASMVASTLTSGQASQIVVIDPAFLPAHPVGMSARRLVFMSLAMALFFGIGLALALALVDDRIHDGADVERLELTPLLIETTVAGEPAGGSGAPRESAPAKGSQAKVERLDEGKVSDMGGLPTAEVRSLRQALMSALQDPPEMLTPAPAAALLSAAVRADLTGPETALATKGSAGAQPVRLESPARVVQGIGEGNGRAPTQLAPVAQPGEVVARTGGGALAQPAAAGGDPAEAVRVHPAAPGPRIDPRLFMLDAPDSAAAASFRVLRHRLGKRQGLKVILVASPGRGEGKTRCAVNLALALGEAGRARVVLLEANFRDPSVARLLGFHPPICVSEQLEMHRDRPAQPWVVVEAAAPWLHVVAVDPNSSARPMLDGPALTRCIQRLRGAGYDYIVVDGPAILESADVNLMEESVDGILLTLWAGKSRIRALRRAIDQVGVGKVLGAALLRA